MCVGVAPDHDRGTLGEPQIALPQVHALAPRLIKYLDSAHGRQPQQHRRRNSWAQIIEGFNDISRTFIGQLCNQRDWVIGLTCVLRRSAL